MYTVGELHERGFLLDDNPANIIVDVKLRLTKTTSSKYPQLNHEQ
jgi:hypothetical protein